ncbi:MAG: hypothetical protein ABFD82_17980 [Syntrophaceae bacterium]
MKVIKIDNCGECPHIRMGAMWEYCSRNEMSKVHRVFPDDIHPDCPLPDDLGPDELWDFEG